MANPDGAVTVVIVDDEQRMLELLVPVLESEGTFRVVATADTGAAALRLVGTPTPGLVVVDVHMPDGDGFELTRLLLAAQPELKVVVTSGMGDAGYDELSRQVGACGYLPKRRLSASALRSLLAGEAVATP